MANDARAAAVESFIL
jgi:hypothetical protein